ncbi:MAG: hypothetical protein Q9181_006088 [Wetmoreana brouardii]
MRSSGDPMEESISLLERAGLNALLAPHDGPERVQDLIITFQNHTSDLAVALRRYHRWVDISEREIDTGLPLHQDLRGNFQEFSIQVTQVIESLSDLSQLIYRRILALQRDGITDREALAKMHEKHEYETLDFVRLVDLWLLMQHASRCMLFGSPDDDLEPEDLEQPPPSPASDSSLQIRVDEAFSLQSSMTCGLMRRQSRRECERPENTVLLIWLLLLTVIVLLHMPRLLGVS